MTRTTSRAALGALFLTVGAAGPGATAAPAQDLLITNVRIVDPDARTTREGNVLVRDGAIAAFPSSAPAEFEGETLDGGGRWLIPALTDLHTHSFGNTGPSGQMQMLGAPGTARVALYVGVARFLDLFAPEDMILALRDRQRAGGVPGAEILAAGPCLTATNGHCSEYGVPTRLVNTPAEAREQVDALAPRRPDVVKVVYDHADYGGPGMPSIDRPTLAAVVEAASDHGLRTVVHVGTWDDLRDAVEVGAAAVTHTPAGEPPPDLVALMVERGTFHIPTLAVQSDYAHFLERPELLDDPLLARVTSEGLRDAFREPPEDGSRMARWVARQRAQSADELASVARLAAAGVIMLTGTDAGNPAVFQGYSVHRELALLVEAGLSPWDALAASTTNAGRLLGRKWGMELGDEATFVLLDASPIEDIRNTTRIHAVVERGRVVDREALLPS